MRFGNICLVLLILAPGLVVSRPGLSFSKQFGSRPSREHDSQNGHSQSDHEMRKPSSEESPDHGSHVQYSLNGRLGNGYVVGGPDNEGRVKIVPFLEDTWHGAVHGNRAVVAHQNAVRVKAGEKNTVVADTIARHWHDNGTPRLFETQESISGSPNAQTGKEPVGSSKKKSKWRPFRKQK